MLCQKGYIATLKGATTDQEGCEKCTVGTYSLGGNQTACQQQDCDEG